jgi:3-phosphoshikimate 1-carboxyvinyltransferase
MESRVMKAIIKVSKIRGTLTAPPSKSMAHRLLICAGLADGVSNISNIAYSEDILATINCLKALGAEIEEKGEALIIKGKSPESFEQAELYCNESGSTLRFLIPIAAMSEHEMIMSGTDRLMSRPLSVYEEIFASQGLLFEKTSDGLKSKGKLRGGEYKLKADISSQFISGLLMALPLAEEDSIILPEGRIESRPYIDMTMNAMKAFGVKVYWESDSIVIPGRQKYIATDAVVEGDWSNAAYLMALGADVSGVDDNSLQGDKVCKEHFKLLDKGFTEIDISDCPDLGPALMAYAAMREGCVLHGTKRLKIKESDRGNAMKEELSKFGIEADIQDNSIRVSSGIKFPKEELYGHNDHRIVMALAALCLQTGGVIEGAEAVSKSFPDFFDAIKSVGADFTVQNRDEK